MIFPDMMEEELCHIDSFSVFITKFSTISTVEHGFIVVLLFRCCCRKIRTMSAE